MVRRSRPRIDRLWHPRAGAGTGAGAGTCRSRAAGAAPVAAEPAPAPVGTWTGDLDGMTERRVVRMLVIYSKTSYFLDNAQQRGATYDMGMELEKWLNRGNKDRARPIRVVFIPTSRARLLSDLAEGRGDIAAAGLAITPERQALVSFATPFADDVSEILVTSAEAPVPATIEELSGTKRLRAPFEQLLRQSRIAQFEARGRKASRR